MIRLLALKRGFLTLALLMCLTFCLLFTFSEKVSALVCDVIRFQEIYLPGGGIVQVYYTTCGNAAFYEDDDGHGSWQICNNSGACVGGVY
jgi:hypothetical protein